MFKKSKAPKVYETTTTTDKLEDNKEMYESK